MLDNTYTSLTYMYYLVSFVYGEYMNLKKKEEQFVASIIQNIITMFHVTNPAVIVCIKEIHDEQGTHHILPAINHSNNISLEEATLLLADEVLKLNYEFSDLIAKVDKREIFDISDKTIMELERYINTYVETGYMIFFRFFKNKTQLHTISNVKITDPHVFLNLFRKENLKKG